MGIYMSRNSLTAIIFLEVIDGLKNLKYLINYLNV